MCTSTRDTEWNVTVVFGTIKLQKHFGGTPFVSQTAISSCTCELALVKGGGHGEGSERALGSFFFFFFVCVCIVVGSDSHGSPQHMRHGMSWIGSIEQSDVWDAHAT